jgi:hypothetical protein
MEQNKQPVNQYHFSRPVSLTKEKQSKEHLDACARGNPKIDGKFVKGYN